MPSHRFVMAQGPNTKYPASQGCFNRLIKNNDRADHDFPFFRSIFINQFCSYLTTERPFPFFKKKKKKNPIGNPGVQVDETLSLRSNSISEVKLCSGVTRKLWRADIYLGLVIGVVECDCHAEWILSDNRIIPLIILWEHEVQELFFIHHPLFSNSICYFLFQQQDYVCFQKQEIKQIPYDKNCCQVWVENWWPWFEV